MKNLFLWTALACAPLAQGQGERADVSKRAAELVIKDALKRSYGFGPGELPPLDGAVKAGDVAWHGSFEDALAAAGASGKPVLLFQLLGRLDDEFC
jgi:hypothetical protein